MIGISLVKDLVTIVVFLLIMGYKDDPDILIEFEHGFNDPLENPAGIDILTEHIGMAMKKSTESDTNGYSLGDKMIKIIIFCFFWRHDERHVISIFKIGNRAIDAGEMTS